MKKIIRPDRRTATSFQVVAAPGRTLNVWFQKVNCQSRNPEQKKKNHGARHAQVKQLALCRSIWKSDSFKKSHTLACGSRYVYNNCFKKQRKYKKRKTGPFQVRFHGRWSIWFRLWKHAPPGRERDGGENEAHAKSLKKGLRNIIWLKRSGFVCWSWSPSKETPGRFGRRFLSVSSGEQVSLDGDTVGGESLGAEPDQTCFSSVNGTSLDAGNIYDRNE